LSGEIMKRSERLFTPLSRTVGIQNDNALGMTVILSVSKEPANGNLSACAYKQACLKASGRQAHRR
jgi:hypothetical protein